MEVNGVVAIRLTGTRRLTKLPLTLAMLKVSIPPGFRRVKDATPQSSGVGQ